MRASEQVRREKFEQSSRRRISAAAGAVRRGPLLLLCSVLPFLAGGCAVNQEAEVAEYRRVLSLDYQQSEPESGLSLTRALFLANQANERLAVQGENYLRALIARRRTAAAFVPTVSLVPSVVLRDQVPESAPVSDDDIENDVPSNSQQKEASFDLAGELQFTIFDGFRDVHRYWRDSYEIERERNRLLSFRESLLLDVARVYLDVLRAEESVRVLENSLVVQEERLRTTRGRLEAGLARSLDLAQTEAQVSQTRITLINARRDAKNARATLSLLLGLPVKSSVLYNDITLPPKLEEADDYLAAARAARRELAAAAAAVEAAKSEVEIAFGQYYPTITIDFAYFFSRDTAPTEREWDGLLRANLPIFRGGEIRADVREAWSFAREAMLMRSYLERQVEQEVRLAFSDVKASIARLAELQVQHQAAEQAFRLAEASYRAGLVTNLERVAAQDALLVAQLQLASEQFDRALLYLRLLQSVGTLSEEILPSPEQEQTL